MTFIIIVWGARGRWFESSHPDKIKSIDSLMIVDAFLFFVHIIKYYAVDSVVDVKSQLRIFVTRK